MKLMYDRGTSSKAISWVKTSEDLTEEKKSWSVARAGVENYFGQIKAKFSVFQKGTMVKNKHQQKRWLAAMVFHDLNSLAERSVAQAQGKAPIHTLTKFLS